MKSMISKILLIAMLIIPQSEIVKAYSSDYSCQLQQIEDEITQTKNYYYIKRNQIDASRGIELKNQYQIAAARGMRGGTVQQIELSVNSKYDSIMATINQEEISAINKLSYKLEQLKFEEKRRIDKEKELEKIRQIERENQKKQEEMAREIDKMAIEQLEKTKQKELDFIAEQNQLDRESNERMLQKIIDAEKERNTLNVMLAEKENNQIESTQENIANEKSEYKTENITFKKPTINLDEALKEYNKIYFKSNKKLLVKKSKKDKEEKINIWGKFKTLLIKGLYI